MLIAARMSASNKEQPARRKFPKKYQKYENPSRFKVDFKWCPSRFNEEKI